MSSPDIPLLSTLEASNVLGLPADNVQLLAREGRLLPAEQGGKNCRPQLFRRTDVENLAAERASGSGESHSVQFYESEPFLVSAVCEFLGNGLRAGAPVGVIATAAHRAAFCERLKHHGCDILAAQARGQLVMLDADQSLSEFMLEGVPNAARFQGLGSALIERLTSAVPGVRCVLYGEMVDLLWRRGNRDGAIQLEELWNELGQSYSFSLLCAYALENFDQSAHFEQFQRVCLTHSHVVPAESYPHGQGLQRDLRTIAQLQQKARALENEIEQRKRAESSLLAALAESERRGRALQESQTQLSVQNEQLARALGAKDEFLAMLGHELRNPLAPIVTALELLRARGIQSREHDVIARQVRQLVRQVDDLLDISRLTQGKVELHKCRLELAQVVARGVEQASPLLESRRQHLEVQVRPSGLVVEVDPDRLAQVLANLLTNAAKYSDVGSRIVVWGERTETAIRCAVRDEGIGISPELIQSVFEAFVQERQAIERSRGGMGLGLAIVRNLVELHRGTVRVHSDGPGRGSEFVIELPLPGEPALKPEPPPQSVAPSVPPRRVLIVDDNEASAILLAALLRELGHTVELAHDPAAALELAPGFAPEVALLDLGLPVMDGYELASRLRALHQPLRVIALSGYGQKRDRERSARAGFALHLTKPVELPALLEALAPS